MSRLRATRLFHEASLTLIVVESIDFQIRKGDWVSQAYGHLKPVAVIVCKPDRTDAFDIGGMAVELDQLIRDTPGLEAMMVKKG